MAYRVFLGVGHGGSDPGAVANGLKEKDLNLTVAMACQDELARHGILVKMSRTVDENESISEKVKECNTFNADLAADIHFNAGGGDGAEVFYSVGGGTGKVLAQKILDQIVALGQQSRGIKTKANSSGGDYFGFIRSTKCPAVIVEGAFLDSKDVQLVDTKDEQIAMGVAIAKGFLKALGVTYKAPEAASVAPSVKKTYRVQVGYFSQRENALAMAEELKAKGYDAIIKEE